jgi:hypothetical protein
MNMSFKNLMMASLFSLGMFPAGYAANVTNQITGVGPTHAEVRPYVCIQDGNGQVTYVLKPGETVDTLTIFIMSAPLYVLVVVVKVTHIWVI